MGARSEAPHPCWASWFLRLSSLLLGTFSTAVKSSGAHGSGVEDSGNPVSLMGIQGGSMLFHVTRPPELPPEAELERISWGILSGSHYRIILHVSPGADAPEWVSLQEKFQNRVHVLNPMTLRINSLTVEDSGRYRTRASLTGGIEYDQYFHLTVYEPVPRPQMVAEIPAVTPDWCNVTLECHTTGTTEDLMVSWESQGLPRESEQRGAPGAAPNPWTLALNLPLPQPSPSVTCVVSNPVDQQTATRDLGEACVLERDTGPHGQASAVHLRALLGALGVVLLVLGVGLYLWRSRGKKKSLETGRGSQEEPRDHDGGVHYAELSRQVPSDSTVKGPGEPHLEQETPLTTVYSEVRMPGQGMAVI